MAAPGFTKDLVTDRQKIPDLEETDLISLDETRLAKLAAPLVSAIGALGAGILAWLGLNNDAIEESDPSLVLLAAGLLLGVSVVAWAIIAAADVRARGQATAANLALRTQPPISVVTAPAGSPGGSAGLWVHIRGREQEDRHLVIGANRKDATTRFLLARNDEVPTWHDMDELDSFSAETGSTSEQES